ncbi:hypothetical protein SAFG77S_05717 [Streptomyces afghaniensis]
MSDPTEANGTAGSAEAAGPAESDGGTGGRRVRVVLVDDHRMFRTGVQAEIGQTEQTGVEVVGEAADVTRRSRSSPRPGPRWSSSTCTCPVAAVSKCCAAVPR